MSTNVGERRIESRLQTEWTEPSTMSTIQPCDGGADRTTLLKLAADRIGITIARHIHYRHLCLTPNL